MDRQVQAVQAQPMAREGSQREGKCVESPVATGEGGGPWRCGLSPVGLWAVQGVSRQDL